MEPKTDNSETAETAGTSKTPEAAAPKEEKGIQRGKIGLNVAVQVVLGLALFVMANVIAHRRWKQWDYTYDRTFTLAETTEKFAGAITEPVRVTVLTPRDMPVEQDLQPLLDQYKRVMGDKLKVEFIDTRRDPEAWANFRTSQKTGMTLPQNAEGVLVQADNPHREAGGEKYFYKWIPQGNLYQMDEEKKIPVAFRGESLMNTALAEVTQPDRPRVGMASRIGNIRTVPNAAGGVAGTYAHVLTDICASQNIEVEPWLAQEEPREMMNYKMLIFAATTIFGEQQQSDLTQYFETPGNSLLILLDPNANCEEMNGWLKKYGVDVQADRVIKVDSRAEGVVKHFAVDAQFAGESPVTRGLENRMTLLLGESRSLKLLTDIEKVKNEGIELKPLLQPAKGFWGEKDYKANLPIFDKGEDNGPPLNVVVAVERGVTGDPTLQARTSRMVVTGNLDLALPPPSQINYDFLTRSINWLLHREEAAPNDTSTDKAKSRFSIPIQPAQWKRVLLICTIVLPLTALMAGLLIWSTRRN